MLTITLQALLRDGEQTQHHFEKDYNYPIAF